MNIILDSEVQGKTIKEKVVKDTCHRTEVNRRYHRGGHTGKEKTGLADLLFLLLLIEIKFLQSDMGSWCKTEPFLHRPQTFNIV